MRIVVDADGCPVKAEILRVARRGQVPVLLVANQVIDATKDPLVTCVVVGREADAADDWIATHVEPADIVVTTDVPLAARVVGKAACVLRPTGKPFTPDDVGAALAVRDLLTNLRAAGERTGGPPPFGDRDRSAFLQALDAALVRVRRAQAGRR